MKSGKVLLGYKSTLKSLRMGKGTPSPTNFHAQAAHEPILCSCNSGLFRWRRVAGALLPLPPLAAALHWSLSRAVRLSACSQAHHHLQQLPAAAQVRDRVLCDACQDCGPPLQRQ